MSICPKCGTQFDANFCPNCGTSATQQTYQQPYQQPYTYQQPPYAAPNVVINNVNANSMIGPKSKIAALLLCIFLGGLGIHRFYVGKVGTGIIYLCTAGLFGFGVLVDIILIATGGFRDANGMFLN